MEHLKLTRARSLPLDFKELLESYSKRLALGANSEDSFGTSIIDEMVAVLNQEYSERTADPNSNQSSFAPLSMRRSSTGGFFSPPSSLPEISKPRICLICYESETTNPQPVVGLDDSAEAPVVRKVAQPCGKCQAAFCLECLKVYFTSQVTEALMGVCPLMRCADCRSFLPFQQWSSFVDKEVADRYRSNATQMLSLQCGGCHSRGSLFRPSEALTVEQEQTLRRSFRDIVTESSDEKLADHLLEHLDSYNKAAITPYSLFNIVAKCFQPSKVQELSDKATAARKSSEDAKAGLAKARAGPEMDAELARLEAQELQQLTEEKNASAPNPLWQRRLDLVAEKLKIDASESKANESRALEQVMTELREINIKVDDAKRAFKNLKHNVKKTAAAKTARLEYLKREWKIVELEAAAVLCEREFQTFVPLKHIMEPLLDLVPDMERRASLHLRYVVTYPTVNSLCCHRKHCFNCKVQGDHPGRKCADVLSGLSNDIRYCPKCHSAIVKGDGCDSITCVCGHNFSFSEAPTQ